MTTDEPSETPVSKALKKRKELQEAIRVSMKELEKIDEFLRMWRQLTAPENEEDKGAAPETGRLILGRAGYGQTQRAFEQMVRAILQESRRPMQSSEIVEAFQNRGEPIGGNATRTAWNRLWEATKRGTLINVPKYGYWLADEPVPPAVLALPPPKRKKGIPGKTTRLSWTGRPQGRRRILNEADVKLAENLLLGGKSFETVAREMGGISVVTLRNYFPGGRKALKAKKTLLEAAHSSELAPTPTKTSKKNKPLKGQRK